MVDQEKQALPVETSLITQKQEKSVSSHNHTWCSHVRSHAAEYSLSQMFTTIVKLASTQHEIKLLLKWYLVSHQMSFISCNCWFVKFGCLPWIYRNVNWRQERYLGWVVTTERKRGITVVCSHMGWNKTVANRLAFVMIHSSVIDKLLVYCAYVKI